MTGAAASQRLPAADRRVDVGGVEIDTATAPAGAFGRDHRRAAAEKGVEDNLAAGRLSSQEAKDRLGEIVEVFFFWWRSGHKRRGRRPPFWRAM
jgi:hypothetical protein